MQEENQQSEDEECVKQNNEFWLLKHPKQSLKILALDLGLYLMDIGSDMFTSIKHKSNCHYYWATMTLLFVLLPGWLHIGSTFCLILPYITPTTLLNKVEVKYPWLFKDRSPWVDRTSMMQLIILPQLILVGVLSVVFAPIYLILKTIYGFCLLIKNPPSEDGSLNNEQSRQGPAGNFLEVLLEAAPQVLLQVYAVMNIGLDPSSSWQLVTIIFSLISLSKAMTGSILFSLSSKKRIPSLLEVLIGIPPIMMDIIPRILTWGACLAYSLTSFFAIFLISGIASTLSFVYMDLKHFAKIEDFEDIDDWIKEDSAKHDKKDVTINLFCAYISPILLQGLNRKEIKTYYTINKVVVNISIILFLSIFLILIHLANEEGWTDSSGFWICIPNQHINTTLSCLNICSKPIIPFNATFIDGVEQKLPCDYLRSMTPSIFQIISYILFPIAVLNILDGILTYHAISWTPSQSLIFNQGIKAEHISAYMTQMIELIKSRLSSFKLSKKADNDIYLTYFNSLNEY